MNYSEIIAQLFQASASRGVHFGLKHSVQFDEQLGHPTRHYRTIHVAGSNGKGSVSLKIAKALEYAGYNVGLYTSPHLSSFRERIVVNSEPIDEASVVEGMQEIFALESKLGIQASFFELTTFLAFEYFRKKLVEFAVIETGLGGKFDATNIILPVCSVITSISREHAHILGHDLETIASEKAGIIKSHVPLVLGSQARLQSIYARAKELEAPVYISKKISQFFDEENSAVARLALEVIAITSLEHLPAIVPQEALEKALVCRPPCRLEQIGEVIFDVAHNPDAIFHLLQALHTLHPNRKFRFLVGFSEDKEYDSCLELIADVATHIHLVQASLSRAAPIEKLAQTLHEMRSETPFTQHETIDEGMRSAYQAASEEQELLIVTGSFYLMADTKAALGIQLIRDPYELNEKTLVPLTSKSS